MPQGKEPILYGAPGFVSPSAPDASSGVLFAPLPLAFREAESPQVDAGELLGGQDSRLAFARLDLRVEVEALEDVVHSRREGVDVAVEVLADAILIAGQLLHPRRLGVAETLPGPVQQERLGVQAGGASLFARRRTAISERCCPNRARWPGHPDAMTPVPIRALELVVPPSTISLPVKILLFILINGWVLVSRALLNSYWS